MISVLTMEDPEVTLGAIDWIGFHLRGDVLSIVLLLPGSLHTQRFTLTLDPRKVSRCRPRPHHALQATKSPPWPTPPA